MIALKITLEYGKWIVCLLGKDGVVWQNDMIVEDVYRKGLSIPDLFRTLGKTDCIVDAKVGGSYNLDSVCSLYDAFESVDLKTLLEKDDCYYFRPVFFTLVKLLGVSVMELVESLRPIVACQFMFDGLERPSNLDSLSLETIKYCISHFDRWDLKKEHVSSLIDYSGCMETTFIQTIQETHFPMVTTKNLNRCIWNPFRNHWEEMTYREARLTMKKIYKLLAECLIDKLLSCARAYSVIGAEDPPMQDAHFELLLEQLQGQNLFTLTMKEDFESLRSSLVNKLFCK